LTEVAGAFACVAAEAEATVMPKKASTPTAEANTTKRGARKIRLIAILPEWVPDDRCRDDTLENGSIQIFLLLFRFFLIRPALPEVAAAA
jgi:hypothetical protein